MTAAAAGVAEAVQASFFSQSRHPVLHSPQFSVVVTLFKFNKQFSPFFWGVGK